MQELVVDFITSLDGYASAEGWPGWWGLQGPEYLAWLGDQPERDYTILMGANTYRLMSGFAAEAEASESEEATEEEVTTAELSRVPKVVFSSTLQPPLTWANTQLVSGDAVEAVGAMKRDGSSPMVTLGSLTLCRSLLEAGLVDRYRVVVFPVITGKTGRERIYDGYPDVALEMVASQTFDGRIQLLEYVPTLTDGPPETQPAS
ncbi:MAG TPA: dihydrofolate reductase family protein [Acidimicrobiia bacterium]|nr:dihydrofolate reductase family protein [Acidimicrobiia bacterium]